MKLVQHLKERGMNPKLYSYGKSYSDCSVTFFLYNLSGQIVGYQRYRPNVNEKKVKNDPRLGRYYTYLPHKELRESADSAPRNTLGVFGLEVCYPLDRRMFVTEGIFKAAVLHRLGFNAIAVLTATPKPMKPWFKVMRQTWDLIAIGDPDAAGQKLVNTVGKGFCSPLDLDDMKDEEILELIGVDYERDGKILLGAMETSLPNGHA